MKRLFNLGAILMLVLLVGSMTAFGQAEVKKEMPMVKAPQGMMSDYSMMMDHFNKMMAMKDMTMLQTEMKKHHELMAAFKAKLDEHQKMCPMMQATPSSETPEHMGHDMKTMPKKTTEETKVIKKDDSK